MNQTNLRPGGEQLEKLRQSPLQQQLQETLIALEQLHYDAHHHQKIRPALRQAASLAPAAEGLSESGTTRLSPAQAQLDTLVEQYQQQQEEDCYPDSSIGDLERPAAGTWSHPQLTCSS